MDSVIRQRFFNLLSLIDNIKCELKKLTRDIELYYIM